MDADRPMWRSAKAFILAVVGAGTGYGSFFRLPYMFHRFGAGCFLAAYAVALLTVSWPLSVFEIFIGQQFRRGAIESLESVHPRLRGLGYASVIFCSAVVPTYFSVVMSWSLFPYLIASFKSPPPYNMQSTPELQSYFFREALYSSSNNNWSAFVAVLIVWVVVALILIRGVRSATVSVYLVVPLPLIVLVGITIYALTLPTTPEALRRHMIPSPLDFLDVDLWANAVGQSFLTLQVASGVMFAYGSYARPVHNALRISVALLVQAMVVTLVFALCVVATLGSVSNEMQPSHQVVGPDAVRLLANRSFNASHVPIATGLHVAFIVYPPLLGNIAWGNALAIVFFVCVILLGLQSVAASIHALFTVLKDHFMSYKDAVLVGGICVVCAGASMPLVLASGFDFLMALDAVVVTICLPMFAFVECIGIGYLWADRSIIDVFRERNVNGGTWQRVRAFAHVAYQHSVGRLYDLLTVQGKEFYGQRMMPFVVKVWIPMVTLFLCVGSAISTFLVDTSNLSRAARGTASLVPILSLLTIVVFAATTKPRKAAVPWSDNDIVQAAHGTDAQVQATSTTAFPSAGVFNVA